MKKNISLLLSIIFIFSLCFTHSAAYDNTIISVPATDVEIECTVADLESGIEVKCYYDTNGNVYANPSDSQISAYSLIDLITFSVKLHRFSSSEGYLGWTITLSPGAGGLTGVSGYMYCKSFSIFKDPYAYQVISGGHLSGATLSTSGTGAHFALPNSGTKVKVGWEKVIVRTVNDAVSLQNVWSTVVI